MSENAPHLLVAALGGTIASTSNQSGGVAPALSGAEIAAAAGLDQIWPDLQADFTQVSQVSSANVTLDMLFDVRELARTTEADGIVLTQGTDTSRKAPSPSGCSMTRPLTSRPPAPCAIRHCPAPTVLRTCAPPL